MRASWFSAFSLAAATLVQEGAAPAPPQGAAPLDAEEAPLVGPALPPATPDSPDSIGPLEPRPQARYHDQQEADELFSRWLGGGFAERLELGESAGGRPLVGLQFGGRGATPLSERTSVFLIGGLDGVSLVGAEAVLFVVDALLAAPERLPAEVTFVAVPWANPDGLARWARESVGDGRNDRPIDDDGDGRVDEDGPADMDGDGLVLELLIEDAAGPWARAVGGRFLRPARSSDAQRFVRLPEGADDDGDGRFNEDPAGGVALDQSFPWAWRGTWSGVPAGPWPLSEPEAQGLAELALARRTALVLLFQGNHGTLAAPGGVRAPGESAELDLPYVRDEAVYRRLGETFAALSARPQAGFQRLAEARRAERTGAACDWFYAALGALSMEVGVWGPEVQAASDAVAARYAPAADERQDREAQDVSPIDRAWARWLDDTRGGIGFVDWQPVDLGGGRKGWIGGWEPRTCHNPPADVLPQALAGLERFPLQLAVELPRLEIDVREARRDGEVCVVRARVDNRGVLPTGAGPTGPGLGLVLRLEAPEGTSFLAGEERVEGAHLLGGSSSEEASWILLAPAGSTLRLVAEAPWCVPVVREVRL